MRLVRLVYVGAASAIVACSSFAAVEPDPAPTGGGPDTSSSTSSGGTGGVDATTPDGASDRAFCQTLSPAPTHCADFDDGAIPMANGWDLLEAAEGKVTLLTGGARSGSHAIASQAFGASDAGAALRRAIGPRPTKLSVAMGVRIDAITGGGVDLVVVEMKSDTYTYYALEVEVAADGNAVLREHRFVAAAPETDIANAWALTSKLPLGRWFELGIVLTMASGGSTAIVEADGKTVGTAAPVAHQMTETPYVAFGATRGNAAATWKLAFDDVRVDITR